MCIQIEINSAVMATMSIRGLDDQALAQLKSQAEQEGASLNGLVLHLLQGAGPLVSSGVPGSFDDPDAPAGSWSDEKARSFGQNTAAFAEVDAALRKQAMRPIALDTNTCVAFKRGDADIVAVLQHAIKHFLVAHEGPASRVLPAYAVDATAGDFYLKSGFQAASFNPLHLYLLLLPKGMHRARRNAQGLPACL